MTPKRPLPFLALTLLILLLLLNPACGRLSSANTLTGAGRFRTARY
jgi:hypothetical protein